MADTWIDVLTEEQRAELGALREITQKPQSYGMLEAHRRLAIGSLLLIDALGAEIERLRAENARLLTSDPPTDA